MKNHSLDLNSAIYRGFVRHRRFTPRYHEFKYPLFLLLIKLDEIPLISRLLWQFGERQWNWARFRPKDYIGSGVVSTDQAVKQKIAELVGCSSESLAGDVYLMGQLRYLGLYFSPLNLYFLNQQGSMRYMLAEVSNTPWNERHYYLVDLEKIQPHDKGFHVSPFNPMEQTYHWRVRVPDTSDSKSMIHLEIMSQDQPAEKVFDATMVLKRVPLNQKQLNRVLIASPVQTASIVFGIYWQAIKLFLKRVPFYSHPGKKQPDGAAKRAELET